MKNKTWLVWGARMASLLMLTGIIVVGIMAYGLASGSKVKVDRSEDLTFVDTEVDTEQVATIAGSWQVDGQELDSLKIRDGSNILKFVSETKTSGVEFLMLGAELTADQPAGTKVELSVRTSTDNESWSSWIEMDLDEININNGKIYAENPVLFGGTASYAQYSLTLSTEVTGVTPELYDVSLIFIDPSDKLRLVRAGWDWMVAGVTGKEKVDIITREEWGADETILDWEPEYAPVEQIIVHHTAGADNAPSDPAAVVRGIYYFHAVEKEWGDIGYNYLLDQYGNIYEGRKGGLGVVGAHSTSNNYGSVGIGLIGNYVSATPTANMLTGLIDLVEYVGYQSDLKLTTSHDFEGKNIPVVAGHRDVNSTECPGDVLYSMLPDVAAAASKGQSSLPAKTYLAEYLGQSQTEINLDTNQLATVTIRYKNRGTAVWLKSRDDITLVPVEPYPRNSGFKAASWESAQVVGPVSQKSVMPDGEAIFSVDLKGLTSDGVYNEMFALLGPGGIIEGTSVMIKINNKLVVNAPDSEKIKDKKEKSKDSSQKTEDKEQKTDVKKQVDPGLYSGAWVAQSDPVKFMPGEEKNVWIDIKNTGKVPWYRDGDFPVRLGTSGPIDRNSGFYFDGSGWLSTNRIELKNFSVDEGEVARFSFTVKAVDVPGVYREYFQPVVEGVKWLDDQGIYIDIEVGQPEYSARWVSQSESPVVMEAGRKARLWVELENTGNVTWQKDGPYPVHLATDRDTDRASLFYSPGYWINDNRAATMRNYQVAPGDSVQFEVVVTAPDEAGSYREFFRPVAENLLWMDDLGIYWDIVVN